MKSRPTLAVCLGALVLCGQVRAQHRLDDGLQELARQVASRTSEHQKRVVAVAPFRELDGRQTVLGTYVAESLTTRLFNVPGLRVVERNMLDQVLAELKLAATGVIDPSTAARIGKLLGVEAIVTGSLTDLGSSVAVNCRLIDVATGEVYGAAEVRVAKDDDLQVLNRSAPGEPGAGYADARIVAFKDFDYLRVTIRSVQPIAPTGPGRFSSPGLRAVWELHNREGRRPILVGLNAHPHLPGGAIDRQAPLLRSSALDDRGNGWALPAGAVSGMGWVRAGVRGLNGSQPYSATDIVRLLQLRDRLGRDDNDPADGTRQEPPGWVNPYGVPRPSFYPFVGNRFISGSLTSIAPGATLVVTTDFVLERGGGSEPGVLQVNLELVTGIVDPGEKRTYTLRNIVFDRVLMAGRGDPPKL